MIDRITPSGLLESGMALFHTAQALALAGAERVSGGSADELVDGMMSFEMARISGKVAGVVIRTADEMDSALLDILA